jgi:hypothetical protein
MPAVLAQRFHWLLERRTAIAAEGYTQGIGEWWFLDKRFAVKPGYNKVLITCLSEQTPAAYGSSGLHGPCCIPGSRVRNKFAENRMIVLFLNSTHPPGKGIADLINHVHHIFFFHVREKRQ